jgi:hypothetical protein
MIRHRALKAKPAEPPICQVEVHLVAQPTLRADAHAVADDQHPDHQLRINRGPTHIAVEWAELRSDVAKINEPVDRPQQVIRRRMPLKAEPVEQLRLITWPSPIIGPAPAARQQ